jgi:DNA uptake protein ComE-like DNA-binding protein
MAKKLYVRNSENTEWVEVANSIQDISNYLTINSASSTYATKTELNNIDLSSASAAAVAAIVDSAPSTLNTLNELAAALNDDENFAGTVTTALSNKLNINTASATYLTQVSASTQYEKIIPYSSSTPSSSVAGDLWVDSSTSPPALKTYNGSLWIQLGSAVDDPQAIIASSMFMG